MWNGTAENKKNEIKRKEKYVFKILPTRKVVFEQCPFGKI